MALNSFSGAVILLAAAPLLLQVPPPRDTPPPPPPTPVGTSRISGQVVAADTGAAVKRASVTISGRPAPMAGRGAPGTAGRGVAVQLSVAMGPGGSHPPQITDDAGRFEFPDIPGGIYTIMVSPRHGYVRPTRPTQVDVEEGKAATVAIKLERTGVITGRLLDESGDPLVRARVTALRREPTAGGRLMSTGMGAQTDDLGQFRLFDLPPGTYFVNGADSTNYMSFGPMSPAPGQGYAPTYFPGSASIGGARAIAVKSAQETAGIDFSLVKVAMGRITGTVRDSTGQLATNRASVNLAPSTDDVAGFNRGSGIRPDGTFMIGDIPPGEYYLIASMSTGDGPNAPREGAYVPVTVNGADVTVDLRTNAGATVTGRVVIEGTPQPLPPAIAAMGRGGVPQVMIQARPSTASSLSMMMGGVRPVTAAEDGTFELTGLRGPTLLTATGGRMALKSVMRGAQDLTSTPLEFKGTEKVGSVTVTMTHDVGTLEGQVTNDKGEPVPGAMIVVFTEDDTRWFYGSPFIYVYSAMPEMPASAKPPATSATPGMPAGGGPPPRVPGSFVSSSLLPGRYLVVAFDAGNRPGTDRESLEKVRDQAVIATVMAGSRANVQVRVVK
jgi:hypothetical protein